MEKQFHGGKIPFLAESNAISPSLANGPYSLTSASFRTTAHTNLSSAFFLHLLAPIDFRTFSIQSNHINSGLPAFLLQSGFRRNTVEPAYNDIGLYDTASIASDILRYQLILPR
jgi:hypothetical protein